MNKLMGYAIDFVSFLLSGDYLKGYKIRSIILYGSVVRGDFTKESDIDLFVDIIDSNKIDSNKIDSNIKRAAEDFGSSAWVKKWKKLGVDNKINCLSGRIEEWKDLQRSMISNGLVLYGKYKPSIEGEFITMFLLNKIKPEKKRVFMARKLFGYRKSGKEYKGLVNKLGGEKLSSGCFIVPIQFSKNIDKLLKEKNVKFRIKEFAEI